MEDYVFAEFKLVNGKVISVEPLSMRIEVTLRTSSTPKALNKVIADSSTLSVGDIISGNIRGVVSYGLFISIDQTNSVGLCHLSQLPEEHIKDIEAKYKVGDRVTSKILKGHFLKCCIVLLQVSVVAPLVGEMKEHLLSLRWMGQDI